MSFNQTNSIVLRILTSVIITNILKKWKGRKRKVSAVFEITENSHFKSCLIATTYDTAYEFFL